MASLISFVTDCRVKVYGTDFQGPACESDADCTATGTTCNMTTHRCTHTDDDVIQCWFESMNNSVVASYLFDRWGIAERFSLDLFKEGMRNKSLYIDTCVGPSGVRYRENYRYKSDYQGCTDFCYDPDKSIDIEPRCFEVNEDLCPTPQECIYTVGLNWCWRQWYLVSGDNIEDCENEHKCNWGLDCSGLSSQDCIDQCEFDNASICIMCDGDYCSEVPGNLTESQCTIINTVRDPLSHCSGVDYSTNYHRHLL